MAFLNVFSTIKQEFMLVIQDTSSDRQTYCSIMSTRRLGMSTLRTNALEGVDAKNSITIVAGAGNVTTTNVQEGCLKYFVVYKIMHQLYFLEV